MSLKVMETSQVEKATVTINYFQQPISNHHYDDMFYELLNYSIMFIFVECCLNIFGTRISKMFGIAQTLLNM